VTWRATKIRTKAGNFVVVPNSVVAKETITNYSEPTTDTRLEIEVGASYDTPPNDVKSVIAQALRDEPLIMSTRTPEILIVDFAASAITYRVRVWTTDFQADMAVRDRVRSHIYYAFRRHRITIPYPIQVQIEQTPRARDDASGAELLDGVEIFGSLSEDQRAQLAVGSRAVLFEAGGPIVRQGEPGSSMFVLKHGEAAVTLAAAEGELARHKPGGYFGEMSLLTGDARSATVTAVTDCELIEIDADAFRRVVEGNPVLLEQVTSAVAKRRLELAQHRANRAIEPAAIEAPHTLITRVRHFLRL